MSAVDVAHVGDGPLLAVDLDQRALGDAGGEAERVAPRAPREQHDVVDRWLFDQAVRDSHALTPSRGSRRLQSG